MDVCKLRWWSAARVTWNQERGKQHCRLPAMYTQHIEVTLRSHLTQKSVLYIWALNLDPIALLGQPPLQATSGCLACFLWVHWAVTGPAILNSCSYSQTDNWMPLTTLIIWLGCTSSHSQVHPSLLCCPDCSLSHPTIYGRYATWQVPALLPFDPYLFRGLWQSEPRWSVFVC